MQCYVRCSLLNCCVLRSSSFRIISACILLTSFCKPPANKSIQVPVSGVLFSNDSSLDSMFRRLEYRICVIWCLTTQVALYFRCSCEVMEHIVLLGWNGFPSILSQFINPRSINWLFEAAQHRKLLSQVFKIDPREFPGLNVYSLDTVHNSHMRIHTDGRRRYQSTTYDIWFYISAASPPESNFTGASRSRTKFDETDEHLNTSVLL